MTTVPGMESWRDAGIAAPDPAEPVEATNVAEDYLPDEPRPDLADEADEADVVEQAAAVPDDERTDYP
jgi:hypothetical protein